MKKYILISVLLACLFTSPIYAIPPITGGTSSMTYPDAGIAVSNGSGWALSILLGNLTEGGYCTYATATGISCEATPSGDGNDTEIIRLATAAKASTATPVKGSTLSIGSNDNCTITADGNMTCDGTLAAGGASGIRVASSGNVGIGKSPDANKKLDVSGISHTTSAFWVNGGNSIFDTSGIGSFGAASFSLRTNNTNRITSDSAGKIGIGTASPSYQLDVSAGSNPIARFAGTGGNCTISSTGDLWCKGSSTAASVVITRGDFAQFIKLSEPTSKGDNFVRIKVSEAGASADGNITYDGATLDLESIGVQTTGTITGLARVIGSDGNHTLTSQDLHGGIIEFDGNGTATIDDNATVGMRFCIEAIGAYTVKVRSTKLSDSIVLHNNTDLGSGVGAKTSGTAGASACFHASHTGHKWRQWGDTMTTE